MKIKNALYSYLLRKRIFGDFKHPVHLANKIMPINASPGPKYTSKWYMKEVESLLEAQTETIAQEFFRLLIPFQPKTRYAITGDKVYVFSKEVPNVDPLLWPEAHDNIKAGLYSQGFSGLGDILVVAILLNEFDLRLENLLLNQYGRFIKIDGGWCFAKNKRAYVLGEITENDIDQLPFIKDFKPYNWLDIIGDETLREHSFFPKDFPHDQFFRFEVNKALLRIACLPNALIQHFVAHYFDIKKPEEQEKAQQLSQIIINRKEKLRTAALKNENFIQFLSSFNVSAYIDSYIETYLKSFVMTDKTKLFDSTPESIAYMKHNANMLVEIANETIKEHETLSSVRQLFTPS